EENLTAESLRELGGEPLAGLGAIQVRDVDESRVQRAQNGVAEDRVVVAEGVHGDPGDEVEIARAVFGDQLGAFAGDEQRPDASVDTKQCGGVRRRQRMGTGHAGWTAGGAASRRVPAVACSSMSRSPIRTARTPARKAFAAARNLAAMPPVATPASIICSISPTARVGWATPSIVTPGTSETNSSSSAPNAAATAAAA